MFVCKICGHVHFGDAPADSCPVCHAPSSAFSRDNDAVKTAENLDAMTAPERKHQPVITVQDDDEGTIINVKVGYTEHPMEDEHWIMFIDMYVNGKYQSRSAFTPGSALAPIVEHIGDNIAGEIVTVASCNKHGRWIARYRKIEKDGIYVCSNCGKTSDTVQHLCSPSKKTSTYTCNYCGIKTDDIKHLCKAKAEKVEYVCGGCGRVSDIADGLCEPDEIK